MKVLATDTKLQQERLNSILEWSRNNSRRLCIELKSKDLIFTDPTKEPMQI